MESELPLICERCSVELAAGRGDFWVVKVEAHAEAGPVVITEEEMGKDFGKEMREIVRGMEGMSEREAMDGVYRRLRFYLCRRCYREWVERPAG